jgi:hypothetical protein
MHTRTLTFQNFGEPAARAPAVEPSDGSALEAQLRAEKAPFLKKNNLKKNILKKVLNIFVTM